MLTWVLENEIFSRGLNNCLKKCICFISAIFLFSEQRIIYVQFAIIAEGRPGLVGNI